MVATELPQSRSCGGRSCRRRRNVGFTVRPDVFAACRDHRGGDDRRLAQLFNSPDLFLSVGQPSSRWLHARRSPRRLRLPRDRGGLVAASRRRRRERVPSLSPNMLRGRRGHRQATNANGRPSSAMAMGIQARTVGFVKAALLFNAANVRTIVGSNCKCLEGKSYCSHLAANDSRIVAGSAHKHCAVPRYT